MDFSAWYDDGDDSDGVYDEDGDEDEEDYEVLSRPGDEAREKEAIAHNASMLIVKEKEIETDKEKKLMESMKALGIDTGDKQALKGITLIQKMIKRRNNRRRFTELIREYRNCGDAKQLLARNKCVTDLIYSWSTFGPRLEDFDGVLKTLELEFRKDKPKPLFKKFNTILAAENKLHKDSVNLWNSFSQSTSLHSILEDISDMLPNYHMYFMKIDEALAQLIVQIKRSKSFRVQACSLAKVYLGAKQEEELKESDLYSPMEEFLKKSTLSVFVKNTIMAFNVHAELPFDRLKQLQEILGDLVEATPDTYQDRAALVNTSDNLKLCVKKITEHRKNLKDIIMNDSLPDWCVAPNHKQVASLAKVTVTFVKAEGPADGKKKKPTLVDVGAPKACCLVVAKEAIVLFGGGDTRETTVIPAYAIEKWESSSTRSTRIFLKTQKEELTTMPSQIIELKFKMVLIRRYFMEHLQCFPADPPESSIKETITAK